MSVICITDHNENIYNIMKKATTYHLKSPRYKSKFSVKVRCEAERAKQGHRTWGYAKYPLRKPENYLRKNSQKPKPKESPCDVILDPNHGKKCLTNTKRPPVPSHIVSRRKPVPKRSSYEKEASATVESDAQKYEGNVETSNRCKCPDECQCARKQGKECLCPDECTCPRKQMSSGTPNEKPVKAEKIKKKLAEHRMEGDNIILRNIREIIKAKPRPPVPKYVDTKNGDTHMLNPSGLQPHYIYMKNYGKTPKYVLRLMDERERKLQIKRDELRRIQPECRYITREERDDLLQGLKQNWDELQKNYQGLPIQTDTIPKILRKSQMEAELKQLEKDIVLIERHPYIYIYRDK